MVSKKRRLKEGLQKKTGDLLWRGGCQTGNGHCQDISANKDGETAVSDLDSFGAIFLNRYLDSHPMFQKCTIAKTLFEVAIHVERCLKSARFI